MNDFEMYSFNQVWEQSPLGCLHDDDASILITTYVFLPKESSGLSVGYVYFDDKFAYEVNPHNKNLIKDLSNKQMVSFMDSKRYK